MPSVLSQRNDIVLPRYHQQPQVTEKEGTQMDMVKGVVAGFCISGFLLLFYLLWDSRLENRGGGVNKNWKHGLYIGAFANFVIGYTLLLAFA